MRERPSYGGTLLLSKLAFGGSVPWNYLLGRGSGGQRGETQNPFRCTISSLSNSVPFDALRIFYDVNSGAKPVLLYVETKYPDGSKDLNELKLPQEDRLAGETRWTWRANQHGEWKLRIWLVDENKNQTNLLEAKLAM